MEEWTRDSLRTSRRIYHNARSVLTSTYIVIDEAPDSSSSVKRNDPVQKAAIRVSGHSDGIDGATTDLNGGAPLWRTGGFVERLQMARFINNIDTIGKARHRTHWAKRGRACIGSPAKAPGLHCRV